MTTMLRLNRRRFLVQSALAGGGAYPAPTCLGGWAERSGIEGKGRRANNRFLENCRVAAVPLRLSTNAS
jgi:hypothetical protein